MSIINPLKESKMKKLLLTLLALAAVTSAVARGRCGKRSCNPCPDRCAKPCPPSCMPAPPTMACVPEGFSSQSCSNSSAPCEAWAVVPAEQPLEVITTTNTCYRAVGCPVVTQECIEKGQIRVAPEQDGFSGGCK